MVILDGWLFWTLFPTLELLPSTNNTMPKKQSAKSVELEERIAKALIAIKEKKVKSAYAAAKEFDVNRQMLMNRINSGVSYAEGHEALQHLSGAEKQVLIAWCKHVAAGGNPARHQLVREMAQEIMMCCDASVNTDGMQLITLPSIGKDWVKHFVLCHPGVKTTISVKID
jgi:sRNA-binding carbon storage regulator CsrA